MSREMNRRQVLGVLGAAGMSAVVLGACGSDGDDGSVASDSGTSSTTDGSPTSQGSSTPGPPAPASGGLTTESFGAAASCTVTPEQTEGPYFLDVDQIRSDIREDRQGVRLRVAARVVHADGCTPVKDAVFEIWHCDAGGLYSGFEAASQGGPGGRPGGGSGASDDERYLRGAQVTNADGIAEITTIYPGWYQGRTVHIHAKVQLSNAEALTTQLYFDDGLTDTVYEAAPYSARPSRTTRNDGDGIYRNATTLTVSKDDVGYLGLITLGIDA